MINLGFIGNKSSFKKFKKICPDDMSIKYLDITNLSTLQTNLHYCIVMATNSIREELKIFIRINPHINFLDNIERFHDSVGKLTTSKQRSEDRTGAKHISKVTLITKFPIVAKPNEGRYNRGLKYLNSYKDYREFKKTLKKSNDYIFEEKLDLVDEFRVLTFNINNKEKYFITRKRSFAGQKNPKKNLLPNSTKKRKLINFLKENRSWKTGLIGYDIGLLNTGEHKIIEENRAPKYDRTSQKLKLNIEKELLNFIKKTIKN